MSRLRLLFHASCITAMSCGSTNKNVADDGGGLFSERAWRQQFLPPAFREDTCKHSCSAYLSHAEQAREPAIPSCRSPPTRVREAAAPPTTAPSESGNTSWGERRWKEKEETMKRVCGDFYWNYYRPYQEYHRNATSA